MEDKCSFLSAVGKQVKLRVAGDPNIREGKVKQGFRHHILFEELVEGVKKSTYISESIIELLEPLE